MSRRLAVERCCARRQNTIEVLSGNDQEGKTDQPLPEAVAVIVKDPDGKYVTSRLGEATLTKIAEKTGGEYFHADPKRFGVEANPGARRVMRGERARGARRGRGHDCRHA